MVLSRFVAPYGRLANPKRITISDRANVFPLPGMAAVYTSIKANDPFHIILGANCTVVILFLVARKRSSSQSITISGGGQWSVSAWSENGGGELSLDGVQVENCTILMLSRFDRLPLQTKLLTKHQR